MSWYKFMQSAGEIVQQTIISKPVKASSGLKPAEISQSKVEDDQDDYAKTERVFGRGNVS